MKNFGLILNRIIAAYLNTEPDIQIITENSGLIATFDNTYVCTLKNFNNVFELNSYIENTKLSPIPENVHGTIGYISSIELPTEVRGQGLGTQIVKKLIESAGVSNIVVHAGDPWGTSTTQQENFWYNLGFRKLPYNDGLYNHVPMIYHL